MLLVVLAFWGTFLHFGDDPAPAPPSPQTARDAGELRFNAPLLLDQPLPITLARPAGAPASGELLTLRPADTLDLGGGLRLATGFLSVSPESAPTLRTPLLSSVRAQGGATLERGTSIDFFEVTLAQEALRAGPFTLSALAGVQGAAADTPTGTDPLPPMAATPVAGAELSLALPGGLTFAGRGIAGPRVGGTVDGYDVGLTLSTRWRLNSSASLEIEYQFARSAVEAESFSGELRRESVLVQFKLAF